MPTLGVIVGGDSPAQELSLRSGQALLEELGRSPSEWRAELLSIDVEGPLDPGELTRFDLLLPLVEGEPGVGLHRLLANTERPVLLDPPGIALDKPLCKRLFRAAGLPALPGRVVNRRQLLQEGNAIRDEIRHSPGFPCVVKPACGVAAVGVSLVWEESALLPALSRAAAFDRRILVEPWVDAREIEVALVAGEASRPGELVFRSEVLDHPTRCQEAGVELLPGGLLDRAEQERMVEMARAAAGALGLTRVARVELFLDRNRHSVYVNEINAMPNFLPTSVFRRLRAQAGQGVSQTLESLAFLAQEPPAEAPPMVVAAPRPLSARA